MLKQLRSRKVMKRIMFWTIVLITPPFVAFYGWQSASNRGMFKGQYLARVKDRWWGLRWREISAAEQEMARDSVERRYAELLATSGYRMEPEDVHRLRDMVGPTDIAQTALDDYLLQRMARGEGLDVSRQEIREILEAAFPVRPAESLRQYLIREGKSEEQFIEELAYRRLVQKARSHIALRAKASLFELWQEFRIGQERIQIRYAAIARSDFEDDVKPTSESLEAFYQTNREKYRVGDKVQFRYVATFRSAIQENVEPTTDSMMAHYEENKEKLYMQPRSVRARHVFLSLPDDAPTTHVVAARAKIEKIAAEIKAGGDFAKLADQYSEDPGNVADPDDPSKKMGGRLLAPITETARSVYGEAFKQTALALAQDQVSSPVRSLLGYHLIKADRVTTAGVVPFDEVRESVRRAVHERLIDVEFRKNGKRLKDLFDERSYSTLDALAQAAALPVQITELVDLAAAHADENLGSVAGEMDLIEDLSEGEFTDAVLNNEKAYYVLEMRRRVPSHVPPYGEVAERVRDDYATSQSASLARAVALKLVEQAKTLEDLQRLAEERGLTVEQTKEFTRSEANSVLQNINIEFARSTLRYKEGSIHLTTQGGDPDRPVAFIVWYYEKRVPPSQEEFRKELPSLRAQYLYEVQDALVSEWLHDMYGRIRAEINPVFETPPQQQEEPKTSG